MCCSEVFIFPSVPVQKQKAVRKPPGIRRNPACVQEVPCDIGACMPSPGGTASRHPPHTSSPVQQFDSPSLPEYSGCRNVVIFPCTSL